MEVVQFKGSIGQGQEKTGVGLVGGVTVGREPTVCDAVCMIVCVCMIVYTCISVYMHTCPFCGYKVHGNCSDIAGLITYYHDRGRTIA